MFQYKNKCLNFFNSFSKKLSRFPDYSLQNKCSRSVVGFQMWIYLFHLLFYLKLIIKPKLRKYHARPSQFNLGLENVHFGKTHFRDPNIDARIFRLNKFRSIPDAIFLCFTFFTTVPKNGPKLKKCRKNTKL